MIKKKLFKRCVALSMAMVLTVGAGSTGIIDAVATPATTESTGIAEEEKVALEQAKANQAAAAQTIADVLQNVQAQESIVDGYQSTANAATELTNEVAALPQAATDAETSAVNAKGASLETTYQTAIGGPEESVKAVAEANYNAINTSLANIGMMKNAIATRVSGLPTPAQETEEAETSEPKLEETPAETTPPTVPTKEESADASLDYKAQVAVESVKTENKPVTVNVEAIDDAARTFDVIVSAGTTKSSEKESRTVIVLDTSSSVNEAELNGMKNAANTFITNMDENDKVSVLTVAETVDGMKNSNNQIDFFGEESKGALQKYVTEVDLAKSEGTTVTNMDLALNIVKGWFGKNEELSQNLIVLSDGGSTTDDTQLIKTIKKNATVYTIGYDEAVTGTTTYMKNMATAAENNANAKLGTDSKAVGNITNAIELDSQVVTPVTVEEITATLTDEFDFTSAKYEESKTIELDSDEVKTEGDTWSVKMQIEATADATKEAEAGSIVDLQVFESLTITSNGTEEVADVNEVEAGVKAESNDLFTMPKLRSAPEVESAEGIAYNSDDVVVEKTTVVAEDEEGNPKFEFEKGREYEINLSAESTIAEEEYQAVHVVMMLDNSGSMVGKYNNNDKTYYRNMVREAANGLIEDVEKAYDDAVAKAEARGDELPAKSKITVISYSTTATVAENSFTEIGENIEITYDEYTKAPSNGTNTGYAIRLANEELQSTPSGLQQHVILLTDGIPNTYEYFNPETGIKQSNVVGNQEYAPDVYAGARYAMDQIIALETAYPSATVHTVGMDTKYNNGNIQTTEKVPTGLNDEKYGTEYNPEYNILNKNSGTMQELIKEIFEEQNAAVTSMSKKADCPLEIYYPEDADYITTSKSDDFITGYELLQQMTSTNGTATFVGNADDLDGIFAGIAGNIVEDTTVHAKEIKDTIDPRFTMNEEQIINLVEQFVVKNGALTTESPVVNGNVRTWTAENGGTLTITKDETGNITISWGEAAAIIGNSQVDESGASTEAIDGWSYEIQIEAKEDFLGGNTITSNVASESYIDYNVKDGADIKSFPLPYVNVATRPVLSDLEQQVFVEDNMGVEEFIEKYLTKIDGVKEENIDSLLKGEAVDYYYKIGDTEAKFGTVQITKISKTEHKADSTTNIVTDETDATKFAELIENWKKEDALLEQLREDIALDVTYDFVVEYIPLDINEDVITEGVVMDNTFTTTGLYEAVDQDSGTASYRVDIISGEINIVKEINRLIPTDQAGDAIFQFEVVKTDSEEERVWYRTVRIGEDGSSAREAVNKVISELPRGTYSITELSSMRYDYNQLLPVSIVTGVLAETQNEGHIEVVIGYNADGTTKNNEITAAEVLFNNTADAKLISTDTDVVSNEFVFENGSWTTTKSVETDATNKGDYLNGQGPSNYFY